MRPSRVFGLSLLAGAAGLAACSAAGTPAAVPVSGRISADRLVSDAQRLTVSGTTTLPDGVCLVTQLMAGEALVPDWPIDCISPVQGAWALDVALGERGQPPALTPGVDYELFVWLRDYPLVADRLPFDLDGPAAPSEP